MHADLDALVRLNHEISAAEDRGDAAQLERYLAPALAFRRANGTIVGRDEFLQTARSSGPRTTTVRSVSLLGRDRAFVTCTIVMPVEGRSTAFENARLFVRSVAGDWLVLGWANEPVRHDD